MNKKHKPQKIRIIISVTNDLISDNRVHKFATTLLKNNYKILVIGRKIKNSKPVVRKYKTRIMRLIFRKTALFYFEFNLKLFIILIFSKVDILLANDLDTLPANFLVAKIRNKKLVYDSHELFTEVPELINRKFVKKFWSKIEKIILPKLKNVFTVCDSIAEIYSKKYKINVNVVRNVPIYSKKTPHKKYTQKKYKIIIYQGAINIGRGIENAILAMKYLQNYKLWIIGNGDIFRKIKKLIEKNNLNNKIKLFGRIELEDLPKYTIQADLGISLEENIGLNYYYALPNKIFDYIQAEIPIICSNFPEMKKIIKKYNVGKTINTKSPKEIATQIHNFLETKSTEKLTKNLKIAKKELCWQNEEQKIIEIFNKIKKQINNISTNH